MKVSLDEITKARPAVQRLDNYFTLGKVQTKPFGLSSIG